MDSLKEKSYRTYSYISRYASFPYFYNARDDKYVYGTTAHLSKNVSFVAHKVKQSDTLDSLSFEYYGRPDLYWVIADFNDILDPLAALFGKYATINVPTLGNVEFGEGHGE